MLPKRRVFIIFFAITLAVFSQSGGAWAQGGVPLTLPLFQNNNVSCLDEDAVADASSVTCGMMTEDSADGNTDFPDCVANSDERPAIDAAPQNVDQATYYQNQNLHDDTLCINQAQFAPGELLQVALPGGITGSGQFIGSVVNENFDGANFNDFAYPVSTELFNSNNLPSTAETFLGAAGGGFDPLGMFGSNLFGFDLRDAAEPQVDDLWTFGTNPSEPTSAFFPFNNCGPFSGSGNISACPSDKNALAHDCNNDGLSDLSVTTVRSLEGSQDNRFFVRTLLNNGSGLATPPISTEVRNLGNCDNDFTTAALDEGDFNGDGILDLAISTEVNGGACNVQAEVIICLHGADPNTCSYTCGTPLELQGIITGSPRAPYPFSIAAGDFNGDGNDDAAITLMGRENAGGFLSRLLYLFGDGTGALTTFQEVSTVDDNGTALLNINGTDFTNMVPTSLTKGHFDNDGILDLALTNFHASPDPQIGSLFTDPLRQGDVVVFTSNGTSGAGFTPLPTALQFPTEDYTDVSGAPIGTLTSDRASGIASGDFDRCGGDDIVALSEICSPPILFNTTESICDPTSSSTQRIASFFLNANEAPVVTIGPNLPTEFVIDTAADLPAMCVDPTDDDRTFQWSVVSAPAGANVVFGTPSGDLVAPNNDASTTVTADAAGDYTLMLTCTDFCGLSDDDTTRTQITITVTETPGGITNTQGGNLFCGLNVHAQGSSAGPIWMLILVAPLALGLRRWLTRPSSRYSW